MRARVDAAGSYAAQDVALTAAAQKLRANRAYGAAPWGDPLRDRISKASNTVACCDPPEPCRDPSAGMEVYYHDRFPSVPAEAVVEGAIELLNAKKNLHITKISFRVGDLRCGEMPVALEADHPNDRRLRRLLAAAIPHEAFDRAHRTDADRYAGLKARLDTNTYIKLRIAYLLYQALKLDDADARMVRLDVFRVLASDTKRNSNV